MENPPTGNRWGIPQMLSIGLGVPGGFVAGGGNPMLALGAIGTEFTLAGLGSFLTTNPAGKNFVLAASRMEPNSPYLLKLVNEMLPKAIATSGVKAMQPRGSTGQY